MNKNIVQYLSIDGKVSLGLVHSSDEIEVLSSNGGLYELANEAIAAQKKLADVIESIRTGMYLDYGALEREKRLLAPIFHSDSAHLLVSGTGLTHLGSADTRATMHAKLSAEEKNLTDSMKMFKLGLEGGKPAKGEIGVQPEWFYKGDGSTVVPPGSEVNSPSFSLDFGDEAEIAGVYIIGQDGKPYRIGFVLGNEFSDHKTEKMNYLYLAHSKLRPCSIGPEIALGDLPSSIEGVSKVVRAGNVVWEKPFFSGEDNMTHTIANLEYHHFKYPAFLRPGDIHVHFFGTNTLSFSDNFEAHEGDIFEVQSAWFGKPLRNTYKKSKAKSISEMQVRSL